MKELENKKLAIFNGKNIRRTIHNGSWFFSIIDVIEILTESTNPRRYWSDLKRQLIEIDGFYELYEKIVQLKLLSSDNKNYLTDCANTETLLRIIQSIPSPKAEPFKRWLAKVGYERIQEIEDPELATKRTRDLYKAKGYSDEWIEKRMRGIAIREELTKEWEKRGVKAGVEFAILTSEISKATFGLTPNEYKKIKGLRNENLRDHMNSLEQLFIMLGEASTTEIARVNDTSGFYENKKAAKNGGTIAGNARRALENKTGKKVISSRNYLTQNKKPIK